MELCSCFVINLLTNSYITAMEPKINYWRNDFTHAGTVPANIIYLN